jgi:hypothetical protein
MNKSPAQPSTRSRYHQAARLLALGLVLAGCAGPKEEATANPAPTIEAHTRAEMTGRVRTDVPAKPPDPAAESGATVVGEVPDTVMDTILAALEKLTGASRDDFQVIRAQETIWPDGALGCPQPGMIYTQAQEAGYRVVLAHAGRHYDYRTRGQDYLMLCLGTSTAHPSGSEVPTR